MDHLPCETNPFVRAAAELTVRDLKPIQPLPFDIDDLTDAEQQIHFTSWSTLSEDDYATKVNWKYDHGLVLRRGERAKAAYVEQRFYTYEQWRRVKSELDERREAVSSDPEKLERFNDFKNRLIVTTKGRGVEIITKHIPVFHRSQMRPGRFKYRTQALIKYAQLFWRPSNRSSFIQRNFDLDFNAKWFTRGVGRERFELEPTQFFDERRFLDHLKHKEVYGIKADSSRPQWWVAADLDLHVEKGGRPSIFIKQVEALLNHLQGQGWRICLGVDSVNGIHVMRFFDVPMRLEEVRSFMQAVLDEVSAKHPELEQEAIEAGMKPIRQAEIYPDARRGFRLPMGRGYTALTDRPLKPVKYHRHHGVDLYGADVIGFMNWEGTEMSLEQKLAYIGERLPAESATVMKPKVLATPNHLAEKVESSIARELTSKKVLGDMKGRFREVLVDFYSGKKQVPKSLQTGILLGVNALWAIGFPLERRAEYLLELLQDIEITNPEFSSRMNEGAWDQILGDIQRAVDATEKLRADPVVDAGIRRSNEMLRHWAKAMKKAGFDFGDSSTWNNCWEDTAMSRQYEFVPTTDDVALIAEYVAPRFACSPEVAVRAVIRMVQLAAAKARIGSGMDREYRRALLTDCGISCRENSKLARCWEVVEQLGFIRITSEALFTQGQPGMGRANCYAVGRRVWEQVYGQKPWDGLVLPRWLREAMAEIGQLSWWEGWVDAVEWGD